MLNRSGNQGFTLIELMMAITIFGIVMAAIYSAYMSQQKAYQVTDAVTEAQQNLRAAMYILEREIRMAGYDPKGSKKFGLGSLQPTYIDFSYDDDENGLAGTTEYFRFQRDAANNTLQRCIGTGGPPPTGWDCAPNNIAENITNIGFQYLDSNGLATALPSSVRFVEVTLTAAKDNHQKQLSTRIQCRNLGL